MLNSCAWIREYKNQIQIDCLRAIWLIVSDSFFDFTLLSLTFLLILSCMETVNTLIYTLTTQPLVTLTQWCIVHCISFSHHVLTVHVSSVLLMVLVTCLVAARGPGGHPPAARGLMAASSLCWPLLLVTLTITHWLLSLSSCPQPGPAVPVPSPQLTIASSLYPQWHWERCGKQQAGRQRAEHGTGWRAWAARTMPHTHCRPVVVKLRLSLSHYNK